MSLSVTPVANLAVGNVIAGIIDSPTTSKLWSATPYTSAAAGGAGAPTLAEAAMVGFPTVAVLPTVVAAPDGTNNVGLITLTLAPNAGDVVNASSPLIVKVSPQALAIVASTPTG